MDEPRGSLVRVGALIARSASCGTRWFGILVDEEENGEEEGKRESEREKEWSGVGGVYSIFGGWGKEPDGRRLTRPRRERERDRFKITRHLPERASRS